MKILCIGGTGTISTSFVKKALEQGHDLTVLCRGNRNQRIPKGVRIISSDAYCLHESASKTILNTDWDTVVNWTIYTKDQAKLDINRFAKNTNQYIYISTTSVYDGSNLLSPIQESQGYLDTTWSYSRNKIDVEKIFLQEFKNTQFPVTIVRPCHTYNDFTVPTNIQGLGYGLINRIESQRNILMHGDGNSYWTLTHSDDFSHYFIQLLNCAYIKGEIFHIASDEYHTWNDILTIYSDLIGKKVNPVYMTPEEIMAKSPVIGESIIHDKMYNRIFDLTKIKSRIHSCAPHIPLKNGLARVFEWHKMHPEAIWFNQVIEAELAKLNL